ncbi:tetratricopeptide repeat protein [Roseovarius spongiae]|uniref:Tetratricopeptide repeat protein n=1 Tax=Roseovarius spongiae TaxID=2320272 RepID=A0A3A8B2S7_9RHOB|nr:tetratricopeptide repeat protein [Roseovarius spongiae]RKF14145.1 tetratricopeptide repeat protein [Roseovarius spongiae]
MRLAQPLVALALLATSPAEAAECPPAPDHAAALRALIAEARAAPNEAAGRGVSHRMWALWTDAPDAAAQELLDTGMERREVGDFIGAMKAFEALAAYCPHYAEGYNQRAFVHFLRGDYAAALPDLERAIEITPTHVAARTGLALTFIGLGREGEAALALRAALAMNPWLGERSLLPMLEAEERDL